MMIEQQLSFLSNIMFCMMLPPDLGPFAANTMEVSPWKFLYQKLGVKNSFTIAKFRGKNVSRSKINMLPPRSSQGLRNDT